MNQVALCLSYYIRHHNITCEGRCDDLPRNQANNFGETPPWGLQGDDSDNPQPPEGGSEQTQNIQQLGTPDIPSVSSNIHCLSIIGQIEGHKILPSQNKTTKYEHVIPQLVAVEQNPDIEGLLILLNTVGGDVEAGLAISEMISGLSKPTVSVVLGGGHSIGIPIAVAADISFIAPSATMTIHPIRLTGLVLGVPQTYEYLDKMQDRVVHFVVSHSGIDPKEYRRLMFRTGQLAKDIGTILVGQDAVQERLIDVVGGVGDAVDSLWELINNSPQHSAPSQPPVPAGQPAGTLPHVPVQPDGGVQ